MKELEIPKELRSAVYKLYEQVKTKIRTTEGLSEDFDSNIEVKQGYRYLQHYSDSILTS